MDLIALFEKRFQAGGDIRSYFSPGRVNLIGEYTDFNGGYVFPCGLTMGTYMAARRRKDKKLRMYSLNFEEDGVIECSMDDFLYGKEKNWSMYPKGVIWAFQQKGWKLEYGYDMLVYGDIPNGSGLSSSASLEVLTGVMLRDMNGMEALSLSEIALLGQLAENRYVGVNCGIMDQFAVAMAKQGQAIFLDTNTRFYQYISVNLGIYKIVIASSNKKRSLADSKYNERRRECEEALKLMQTKKDASCLCEYTAKDLEELKGIMKDPVLYRRARHTIYENERTKKAVNALKKNDLFQFGRLMKESHQSLRDDYQVTGIELDTLAEEAWKCEGVIGSRMTGAGFGGCTVSIVRENCISEFTARVGKEYEKKIGYHADFYVADIGEGAHRQEK